MTRPGGSVEYTGQLAIGGLPHARQGTRQDWEVGEICIAAPFHPGRTRAQSPRRRPGLSGSACNGGTRAWCSYAAALRPGGFFGRLIWHSVFCSSNHHAVPAQQHPPERRHQANRHSIALPSRAKTTRSRMRTGAPTGMPRASATSRDALPIETRSSALPSRTPWRAARTIIEGAGPFSSTSAGNKATGNVTSSTRWMRPS